MFPYNLQSLEFNYCYSFSTYTNCLFLYAIGLLVTFWPYFFYITVQMFVCALSSYCILLQKVAILFFSYDMIIYFYLNLYLEN
jgi:hypothetical protein